MSFGLSAGLIVFVLVIGWFGCLDFGCNCLVCWLVWVFGCLCLWGFAFWCVMILLEFGSLIVLL